MTLASDVVARLRQAGQTIATCESLTGGLVGATLTEVPGSSAVFRGGLITYATDLKDTLAGVPSEILTRDGAVAASTCAAMAVGARERCQADWAVAVTGVAGPDPQEGHPAGTVWVGIASPDGAVQTELLQLVGDRRQIRHLTTSAVLNKLLGALG